MRQDTALAILKIGANVFLTGEPGSGKTHTINQYIEYLEEHGVEPAVTASTGIAATHIQGMTIHSWSGIGIKKRMSEYELESLLEKESLVSRLRETHVLIIDEVSMLDADTVTLLDQVLQTVRGSRDAFGGMQIIFVGDFFQLPPVSKGRDIRFAYESPAWNQAKPVVCYLSEQHRQDDKLFLDVLTSLRRGEVTEETHMHLEARTRTSGEHGADITKLYTHNADVDRINDKKLDELSGDTITYEMQTFGSKRLVEPLIRGCLSPEALKLKKGAVVMFTKNNFDAGFVNGTLGRIVRFDIDSGKPVVETREGKEIEVYEMDWAIDEQGSVLAKIVQLPLRLAWAITVHKSQGMSLDAALIDLSKAFEYGQGYVALSRVRTLAGVYLEGYNPRALEVHPTIQRADSRFRQHSDVAEVRFQQLSDAELTDMHHKFLKAVGGSVQKIKQEKKKEPKIRGTKKGHTYQITKSLLLEGKGVDSIAKERDMSDRTIWGHVEKLLKDGEITKKEIAHVVQETDLKKKDIARIQKAFSTLETDKLTPIKEHFNDTYSFEQIRLARALEK